MMDTETELASDAGDFTAPGDPWLHLPENVRFGLSLDGVAVQVLISWIAFLVMMRTVAMSWLRLLLMRVS